ncbi:hypothetical protein Taro_007984 [Colocasia esculenta]|uniref:Methyltransferase small domain-containing protein n=1 Tax=Colocasia esculenta TaxID=4460 RepID=A0A843TWZ4_COLES|nr:hypothetical protein [Colocasia esculenta]
MAVARLPPASSLPLLRLSPTRRPIRFFSSASPPPQPSLPPSPSATQPHRRHRTPLFLRPLAHSTSPADLKAFHSWAASLALSSAASHFSHPSDPEPAHFLRELRWLLQDAAVGSSVDPHLFFSSASSSSPTGGSTAPVPLRVELGELYGLWKERVEERRPLQYLVGCEHWRDLVLVVRDGVLIPRPETEALVDMVAEVMAAAEEEDAGIWADLGTGSGALAVGIARVLGEGEGGKVYATDVSSDAIEVARINVQRYGLEEKVEIRQGSWFQPLQDVQGKLAGLVSNPPYIPSNDILGLQAEVGRHEPRLALDGGENGMDHLAHLCEGSSLALRPGGFFAFETNGDAQSEFIAEFMSTRWRTYFTDIKIVQDFAGVKRFVTGFHQ